MGLICLCGLDRTGKSSVAAWYETQGYEVVHLSAPDKKYTQPGYAGSSYFEDYVDMLMSFNGRAVVMDRFWDGEIVWSAVYSRSALLTEDEIDAIREIEASMDVKYILMHDPDSTAHWQRCVDNKEPLTKPQFVKARALYSKIADKYGFVRKTLKDFPDAVQPLPAHSRDQIKPVVPPRVTDATSAAATEAENNNNQSLSKTKEQQKLDKANVINEVLSKRIIKGKGLAYDELERNVRHFLNGELGKIFGNSSVVGFSNEEVDLLKFFCQRLKDKENN